MKTIMPRVPLLVRGTRNMSTGPVRTVVALGGNALVRKGDDGSAAQRAAVDAHTAIEGSRPARVADVAALGEDVHKLTIFVDDPDALAAEGRARRLPRGRQLPASSKPAARAEQPAV